MIGILPSSQIGTLSRYFLTAAAARFLASRIVSFLCRFSFFFMRTAAGLPMIALL